MPAWAVLFLIAVPLFAQGDKLYTSCCANCHGDVAKMPQVYQVASLRMGWCINCHVQRKVTRDCTVCHY